MYSCEYCEFKMIKVLVSEHLELLCPRCRRVVGKRFIECLGNRELSYQEVIRLYDAYESGFVQKSPNTLTSWEELDVVLNESISRKIRKLA